MPNTNYLLTEHLHAALVTEGLSHDNELWTGRARRDSPVERDRFEMNKGWLSTANGPANRNARTTEGVRIAFQIRSAQKPRLEQYYVRHKILNW